VFQGMAIWSQNAGLLFIGVLRALKATRNLENTLAPKSAKGINFALPSNH
jgi:hypothetical protein